VHKLLGGAVHSELTPYATGFYRRRGEKYLEASVEEARRHLSEGFSAMKLKVGFGVEADVEYVNTLREAVGPEVRIMMDANCAHDAPAPKRILLGCEDAGVHFFEEPLAPEDLLSLHACDFERGPVRK
jgi:D-galactarolactone cycloisomerase